MQEVGADVMIPKFKFDFTSHLENNLREVQYSYRPVKTYCFIDTN